MHFFNFLLVCICAGPARLVRASHTGKHNVTVDDDSSDIVYTGNWSVVQSDLAIGGSMHTTTDPDAFVTYTYSGGDLYLMAPILADSPWGTVESMTRSPGSGEESNLTIIGVNAPADSSSEVVAANSAGLVFGNETIVTLRFFTLLNYTLIIDAFIRELDDASLSSSSALSGTDSPSTSTSPISSPSSPTSSSTSSSSSSSESSSPPTPNSAYATHPLTTGASYFHLTMLMALALMGSVLAL